MLRVLVTGGDSFTARHLMPVLVSKGFECHSTTTSSSKDEINSHYCDITDYGSLEKTIQTVKPNYIIHLAGISFAAHPRPLELYDVNVLATESILRIAARHLTNIKRVILASSANVYGACDSTFIDEGVCPLPVNHYAASKLAMEHMASTWMDRLPITIVRPFNYTGRGQNKKFLVPKIVSHFTEGITEIELGNINIARDFTDVRVICQYYLKLLLEEKAVGETINLCSGRLITLSNILEESSKITGRDIDIKIDPEFVRKSDIMELRGNPEKLYNLIGAHEHPSIKETLTWMLQ